MDDKRGGGRERDRKIIQCEERERDRLDRRSGRQRERERECRREGERQNC